MQSLWIKNRYGFAGFQAIHFLPPFLPPQFDKIYWSDTWTFPHCDNNGYNMQIQGVVAEEEKWNITLKKTPDIPESSQIFMQNECSFIHWHWTTQCSVSHNTVIHVRTNCHRQSPTQCIFIQLLAYFITSCIFNSLM